MIEQRIARIVVGRRDRNAVADAGRFAPDVRERRTRLGRAVQLHHEDLTLLDLAGAGAHRHRERAARLEREATRAARRIAGDRAQRVVERDRAADARRQVAFEIVNPGLVVEPVALAARGRRIVTGHARRIRRGGRAEGDHRFVELDDALPDFGDGALRRHAHRARRAGVQRQGRGAAERRDGADAPEQPGRVVGLVRFFVVLVALLHRSIALGGKLSV